MLGWQCQRFLDHFGLELEEGWNPSIRAMRMTLDPLVHVHRPLLLYACVTWIPRFLGHTALFLMGFQRRSLRGVKYWYRPGPSRECRPPESNRWPYDGVGADRWGGAVGLWAGWSAPSHLPLLFFHGVGPGQCTYASLVARLARNRAAILIEIPHISMGLDSFTSLNSVSAIIEDSAGWRFWSGSSVSAFECWQREVAALVRTICKRHGIFNLCVCGHSFGSIWAGESV
jgi:hypothetical protein